MPAQAVVNGMVAIDGELHDADQLLADSKRWRYLRDNHAQGLSPHMDGTFSWRFTPLHWVRAQNVSDAVDQLIRKEYEQ